jgi:transcriptional regulator with XRE-family HTH domain
MSLQRRRFTEKANIHSTYISSIELGKVNVGIEIANELASALEMRLSRLVQLAE